MSSSPAVVLTCSAPGCALKWHVIFEVLNEDGDTKIFPRFEADQAAIGGGIAVLRATSGSQPL